MGGIFKYSAFLEIVAGVLHHPDTRMMGAIVSNGLPDLNLRGSSLLVFCASRSLSIMKTIKHKGAHQCTWVSTPRTP